MQFFGQYGALLNNSFNGQAAVIVFFIISGFCIHFPNRKGFQSPSWTAYYLRRYVRILIPMGAAIALAVPLRLQFGIFSDSILWSLLCEEVYYLIYPGLLCLRDRLGWRNLLILASVFSFAAILTHPGAKDYPSYGPWLNWALGLPCWLLGVRMAECLELFQADTVTTKQIWIWRAGAWAASVIASVLRFHTPVGLLGRSICLLPLQQYGCKEKFPITTVKHELWYWRNWEMPVTRST